MLAGKTLTDFKNHFLPNKVKRNDNIILKQMFKEMTERNSYKTHNIYPNLGVSLSATPLSDKQQFRLNKINGIKDYFVTEIKERQLMSTLTSLLLTILTSH